MHELKRIQCLPLALLWEAVMILDFVTVTLISNEGSSLALLSPLIAEQSQNRPVRGIAAPAVQMAEKTPGTKPC